MGPGKLGSVLPILLLCVYNHLKGNDFRGKGGYSIEEGTFLILDVTLFSFLLLS